MIEWEEVELIDNVGVDLSLQLLEWAAVLRSIIFWLCELRQIVEIFLTLAFYKMGERTEASHEAVGSEM